MPHETYWVAVSAVIPVLAIASVIELRVIFGRIAGAAHLKDISPEGWYFLGQAVETAALLLALPAVMSHLYDGTEPGWFVTVVVRLGIQVTSTLLVIGPAVEAFRTARLASRVKPRKERG